MLADPETLKRIRNMDIIRAAENRNREQRTSTEPTIIPDSDRVLLKVLTLVIAFSVAVWERKQAAMRPASA